MSSIKNIYESVIKLLAALVTSLAFLNGAAIAEEIEKTENGGDQTLSVGQNINAGTITVAVERDNLVLTYTTTGGWSMDEMNLWAGPDLLSMPTTENGSPVTDQFPYVSGDITGSTTCSFTIPLTELGVSCGHSVYLAAHATLSRLDATNSDGSDLEDINLYVGTKLLPRIQYGGQAGKITVASGQYLYIPERKTDVKGKTSYEMTIDEFAGEEIFFRARASIFAWQSVWNQ